MIPWHSPVVHDDDDDDHAMMADQSSSSSSWVARYFGSMTGVASVSFRDNPIAHSGRGMRRDELWW